MTRVSDIVDVNPKWARSGGLAFVCQKCSDVRIPEDVPELEGDPRLQLREWLKERLKRDGHWGAIRASGSTCLDVCAPGRITVLLDPVARHGKQRCVIVDPTDDASREELYRTIVAELGSG